jgi:hypothetical protein
MMLAAERTYTEGIYVWARRRQQMYIRTCIVRSVIVALSAEPPGVNELCVCVCVCVCVCMIWDSEAKDSL